MVVLLQGNSVGSLHFFKDGMVEVVYLFFLLVAGPNC